MWPTMRTAGLIVASLAIAVVVQVSVLNGLLLPGGGVPDLVLVLACALAMASGPVNGMLIGFAAGLCLDLAPPGSQLVGQYALVFCLAGWAAGRLRPVPGQTARQSAGLVATALLALVVAGAEVLSAVLVKLLTPAAVSLSQLRLVLPSTIVYDVVLVPFVLSLVMLVSTMLAQRTATTGLTRALPGTGRSRRAAKRSRGLPDLHLGRSAGSAVPHAAAPRQRSARLRPAAGVPGSATGLRYERTRPQAAVHLRLAGGRRGDGALWAGLQAARTGAAGPGRHPGLLAGGGRTFRPHVDRPAMPGRALQHRPATISFAGHKGDGSVGNRPSAGRPASARRVAISFAGHRGDGSFGQTLSPGRSAQWRRQPAIHFGTPGGVSSSGPQLRMGARRSAIAAASVPRLTFASNHVPAPRRAPAVPRFRRGASGRTSPAIVAGGVLSEGTFRARRQRAAPRLRLSRVPPGMLGGSGRALLARPPGRAGKQPRFSYGKRSPLSALSGSRVGRRLGGRWLARQRAGGRSGVWLLGRRTGGPR
jgi:rod shape-determining protein MreD